jgi:hypothetical protein
VKTIFLGTEEVTGYLTDLLDRFSPMPSVWCPITRSGRALARALIDVTSKLRADLNPCILSIDLGPEQDHRRDEKIIFADDNPADIIRNQSVLLLDGAISLGHHNGPMRRGRASPQT